MKWSWDLAVDTSWGCCVKQVRSCIEGTEQSASYRVSLDYQPSSQQGNDTQERDAEEEPRGTCEGPGAGPQPRNEEMLGREFLLAGTRKPKG